MKKLILIIVMIAWGTAIGGMLDENSKPVPDLSVGIKILKISNYSIDDITMRCNAIGYFIYNETIYQCVKIRENVTKAELNKYIITENARHKARWEEYQRTLKENQNHK